MATSRVGCEITPGERAEWMFVVGRSFLAALPLTTPQRILEPLARLVAEPRTDIESVVALLPLAGEDAVASFAVVVLGEVTDGDGIGVSVVVRGTLSVDVFSVGGSRRFTDRSIRPWLLADFQAVVGLVIGSQRVSVVPATRLSAGTPIGVGTLAAHRLFWAIGLHPDSLGDGVPGDTELHDTVLRDTELRDTVLRDTELRDTVLRDPVLRDTVLRDRAATAFPDAETILQSGARGGAPAAAATDDTVILRPRAERQPDAGVSGGVPDAGVPDGVPEPARPRYGFRVGGQERLLDSVHLLGRRPRAPRVPLISDTASPRLVTVDSRTSAVSATHLEIRQEGDAVVVTDLGSTNGTIVKQPRGKWERLRGGGSVAVVAGTTVDIGDGNIIEILAAGNDR
jgi:hypothetical protein